MSEAKGQAEPTMEEILASIRRIISEDDAEPQEAEESKPDSEPEAAAPEAAPEPEAEPEPEPETMAAEPAPEPEPEPAAAEPAPEPEPEPRNESEPASETAAADSAPESEEDDVLELTEKVEADGTVVDLAAQRAAKGAAVAEGEDRDSLLAAETQTATVGSLSELAQAAIAGSRSRRGSVGDGRTLEDIVREALAPELKAWLDSNLPALVEQIVREEIKRLVRRAEDQ
jgi:hypothetical protein